MKLITGIVASLVIGSLSFGAFAAKEIQKDEVASMKLTKSAALRLKNNVTDGCKARSVEEGG